MKPIVYTKHVEKRMSERGIRKVQVRQAIRKGREIVWERNRSKEYKNIRVIFSEDEEVISVVTVYLIDTNFETRVNKISGQLGWIKESTKDGFIKEAHMLRKKGLTDNEVIEHLTTMYNLVNTEYTL